MQYLHQPGADEQLIASGLYSYTRAGQDDGREQWELSGLPDGAMLWRAFVERPGGKLLSHAMLSPQAEADRLQLRWIPTGKPPSQFIATFFGDEVLLVHGGRRESVALAPQTGLSGPDMGMRALMIPPRIWTSEARDLSLVFTIQQRDAGFWYKPVKWAFHPLPPRELFAAGQTRPARGVQLSVPGLPEAEAWFDMHGTPLRWQQADGWQAELVRYSRWG